MYCKFFNKTLFAAALVFAGQPIVAGAADMNFGAATPTNNMVIYWGADAYKSGYGVDAGFAYALNGDILSSGWVLSANMGYAYSFDRASSPRSSTKALSGSALIGYQWQTSDYYIATYLGADFVNNDENPVGTSDGFEAGVMGVLGFETKRQNAPYVEVNAAYSTANDRMYGRLRGGYKTNQLKFGAEFTAYDEKNSDEAFRYGAFVGDIPVGKMSMTVSGGYHDDQSTSANSGYYGQIEFSVPLSVPSP